MPYYVNPTLSLTTIAYKFSSNLHDQGALKTGLGHSKNEWRDDRSYNLKMHMKNLHLKVYILRMVRNFGRVVVIVHK